MSTKALSRFMQLLDGSFPSGIFVHSFGLESHVVLGKVTRIDELEIYLHNIIIDQYQKFEFSFIERIFKHLYENNLNALLREDNNYSAMLNFEYAKASHTIGHNYFKHINKDIEKTIVKEYYSALLKKEGMGNELAVLSAYAYEIGLDKELLMMLWCKKSLITLSACTLKISRIKPSEIQQMLFQFDDKIENIINKSHQHVENFNPLFEEVVYQHLHLEPKLFMT
ncbi:MAG: urease accessory protein [Sulfurimonas sp.]|jgi:urease accessory protein|uniref:urease accessory protein UreF n=1 Tax=Sulfurimonas sp. TaxID=2022749 RepID=UPI0039E4DF07